MSKFTRTGRVAKTYNCEDCGEEFGQKSHYDKHKERKIPCLLKDKPLKDVIAETVAKEVNKKLKETDKQIVVNQFAGNDDESDNTSSNSKKQSKKPKLARKPKAKKEEDEIDYSYLRLPENKVIFELKENDNKAKTNSKNKIISMIDDAHNILYGAENIEGEDALNDIMNWMFIKCIQPIISDKPEEGKIDLLNKKHYENLFEDKVLTEIFTYFKDLKLLAKQPLDAIRELNEPCDIIRQMGEILKTHPDTKMIFTENNFIKARKATTIQLLLNNVINKMNIDEIEANEDVIGEIYEHIINGYVKKGSKLGQFFTPRKLMKLLLQYKTKRMIEIINNLEDGSILIGDTCMGTGGWVVSAYNILKSKFKDRLLLTGGEVKPTTFQYGLMNLILTLKEFPHDVHCESSLTHINTIKNHFIFTNPPFQTDKKFDQVKQNFTSDVYTKKNKVKLSDVYTLQDNNPPIQFLELDYYKLEDSGMCMIVLPYGELFFGSGYKNAREHFMENCNITDIILFHGGIFTHTGIKTCALIFEKDAEGTKEINFIQANKECTKLTKITTIKVEDINKEVNKSWYLRDYLKDEYIEGLVSQMTNFEWVEFGKVFTLEKGKIQSSKVEEDEEGEGVMVTQSQNINDYKKINEYVLNGKNLFVGNIDSGRKFCIIYYDGKCDYTNLLSHCKINEIYKGKINIEYIYYYLKSINQYLTDNYLKGSCNLSLDQKNFNRMKIPIPSLEEQEKIMASTQFLESDTANTILLKKNNELKRKFYMECMIKGASRRKLNEISKIGKVCNVTYGTRITKSDDGDENGEYPVYGGGGASFYTDKYNREGTTCKISRFGMSEHNCVIILNEKYYLNDSGFTIASSDTKLTNKYLWNYMLLIKTSIFNTGVDLAQRNINLDKFKNLDIPIPPLERQVRMEKAIDNFDWFDEVYTNRINENEEQIKTAFYESLDTYGNPDAVNIEKMFFGNPEKINKTTKKIDLETELSSDLEADLEAQLNAETSSKNTKRPKSKVNIV